MRALTEGPIVRSLVSLTAVGALIFALAPLLVAVLVPDDPAVIAGGTRFLRAVSWSFGFMGAQMALASVFRASGNMMATLLLTLVSQRVLQFPAAYVLSKHTTLGADGLWWAFPITNVAAAIVTALWFAKGDWKRLRLTEETEEELAADPISEEILRKECLPSA